MATLRAVAEIAIGVVFAAGAVFNTVYTLRHTTEFYEDFAEGAWFGPAESIIRTVIIPNGTLFTALPIAFQRPSRSRSSPVVTWSQQPC